MPPSSELDIGNETQWSINGSDFLREKMVGSGAFFSLSVQVDDKNSSVNVLMVRKHNYNIQYAYIIIIIIIIIIMNTYEVNQTDTNFF